LKRRLPSGSEYRKVAALMAGQHLHTVCQEAKCPNQYECFSSKTAAFLIMGPYCTRNCRFCSVQHGRPAALDEGEPERLAQTAAALGLKYVVVTSVTRDDLPDGGAGHFVQTITALRAAIPGVRVEVLIPDFQGNPDALESVLAAEPDVINHNIETVYRLYADVRPGAGYRRSLGVLQRSAASRKRIIVKSGLMLGLGENGEEIRQTLQDLLHAGCNLLTMGQYLQPSSAHLPVKRFVPPAEFDRWRQKALATGLQGVASGPFVRSSYHARDLYQTLQKRKGTFFLPTTR
jgi:lipoic acid synthetase